MVSFDELIATLELNLKMEPLAYKKMDFEEFCAATISVYQLEAREDWDETATKAFGHFELEGNKVTSVDELAQVSKVNHICETNLGRVKQQSASR